MKHMRKNLKDSKKICTFRLDLVFGVSENTIWRWRRRREKWVRLDLVQFFRVFNIKFIACSGIHCVMPQWDQINNPSYSNKDPCAMVHKIFISWLNTFSSSKFYPTSPIPWLTKRPYYDTFSIIFYSNKIHVILSKKQL